MLAVTSVIIPVRDGSNFLAEAIASALAQLAQSDQVLVVWDGSAEDAGSVLDHIEDPRVHAIRGPERGVSGGRNAGLAAAEGEFVAFLDHDDLWPEGRQQAMLQAFADDPEIDALFGRTRIRLEPEGIPWKWIMNMDGRHNPGANLGSALFRASVLRRIDGFDESRRFGEDFDYFDRLRAAGMRYVLHDGDALIYRRHA